MANREGSAGAGLCPPIAGGSPPPCSWWGREDPQQGREGSRVRGSSQTYLHSQRCGIYAGGDWRQRLPQFPYPPLGCLWCKALPRLSRSPSCAGAEPPPKHHRCGVRPPPPSAWHWGGRGGSRPAMPRCGSQPIREWRPGPVFSGQSSLIVTVKPRLIPVIFS